MISYGICNGTNSSHFLIIHFFYFKISLYGNKEKIIIIITKMNCK